MAQSYSDSQNNAANIANTIAMIQSAVAEGYTVVDLSAYGIPNLGVIKIPNIPPPNLAGIAVPLDLPTANNTYL
jgi:hypothetical protein